MTVAFTPPPLRWVVAPPPDAGAAAALARALDLPLALAGLLVQRGVADPSTARRFLRPSLDDFGDPMALAGMEAAVAAVAEAVTAGRTILVHGDYDVDGQCATALLTRALRSAGASVVPFVPHRLRDGYDFGPAGIAAAKAAEASLVITCDCGITALDAAHALREAGIGLVVTDHHLPGPRLPEALAVVDPQRPDDGSGASALCGTGVALKLVQGLVPALGLPQHLPLHLLDYAAIATVADVVPLRGENRSIVRHGLRLLRHSRWAGLGALVETAGLAGQALRAGHLGFILAPRLNAVGRIGDAGDGLRLLLTDDPAEATALAKRLEAMNAERQTLDQRIQDEALEMVEREADPARDAALVLAQEGWHAGVIGIVASRVVERYGRPAMLIALDGEVGKGSGRSISAFDLHAALTACADHLERYGGHHMAAGITIRRDRIAAFREQFTAVAREALAPEALGPEQRVDLEIDLAEATDELERLCRHLEPCGMGNPGPVFGVRGVRFADRRSVGRGHLKGVLEAGDHRLAAIGFQWADRVPWLDARPVDVAFKLETHEWQGRTSLQARVVGLSPAGSAA